MSTTKITPHFFETHDVADTWCRFCNTGLTEVSDMHTVRVYETDAEPYDFSATDAQKLLNKGLVYRDENGVYWQTPGVSFDTLLTFLAGT